MLLALFVLAAARVSTARADAPGDDGPLTVTAATVRLQVWRGGERRADGERTPLRGAWVDGVVQYELARPARAGEVLVLLDGERRPPVDE